MLATTLRLWLRRRSRRAWIAVLLLVAGLATGAGLTMAGQVAGSGRRPPAASRVPAPPTTGSRAAAWVAGQVGQGVTVSCDPAMCSLLRRHGFPSGNLVMLRPGALDPLDSDLIVATPILRKELGARLASVYAPVVIASFGPATSGVDVRAIAPAGVAAYLSQLRADVAARRSVGAELLRNPDLRASQPARQQLSAGHVDARLVAMIAFMASMHPVRLISFGDASPGANPEVPLRSVVLDGDTPGAAGATVLGAMRSLLLAQQPAYLPAGVRIIRLAAGSSALRITYAAPSPSGLLNPRQPVVKISSP